MMKTLKQIAAATGIKYKTLVVCWKRGDYGKIEPAMIASGGRYFFTTAQAKKIEEGIVIRGRGRPRKEDCEQNNTNQ